MTKSSGVIYIKESNLDINKDALIKYLRYYSCDPEATFEPYDVNWVITLFLTCLDNLSSITSEWEFMTLVSLLSNEQKEFIKNVVRNI